jgi:hypothetical protein
LDFGSPFPNFVTPTRRTYHEERVGALYKALELVLAGLVLGTGVQEVDDELDGGKKKR